MQKHLEDYAKLAQLFRDLHQATLAAVPPSGDGPEGRIKGAEDQQSLIRELNSQAVELGLATANTCLANGDGVEANAIVQLTKTYSDGAIKRINSLEGAIKLLRSRQ